MKKIYLYTIVAAALLASCSEYEYDYSNLSDKNIMFKVAEVSASAINEADVSGRALADDHVVVNKAIKAEEYGGKAMYLQSYVEPTSSRTDLEGISKANAEQKKNISRAAITTDNLSSFGLLAYRYAADGVPTTPNFSYNKEVTKTGSVWTSDEPMYWPWDGDKLDFYAYAPYNGTGISLSASSATGAPAIDFTVQTDAENQIDLVAASAINKVMASGRVVKFTFGHALTTVKFVKDANLHGTIENITLKNVFLSGKYTIGGSWSFTDNSCVDYEAELNTSLMMIPQTFGEESVLEVAYNDGLNDYTLIYSLAGVTWQPGKTVTYCISSEELTTLQLGIVTFPSIRDNLPKVAYDDGDEAGLYVVDADGNIKNENVKLTYDGISWTAALALLFSPDYDYYLYYPYSESGLLNSGTSAARQNSRATSYTPGSANEFFSAAVNAWDLSDQSTAEKFTNADLQIAKGYVSIVDGLTLKFDMTHAMGLAQFDLGAKNIGDEYYLSIDNTYRWIYPLTATSSFATGGYQPYGYATGKYLVLVKPNTATTISSDAGETDTWETSLTFNVAANTISDKQTAYSARTASGSIQYTLQVGDILYSDGSLSHQSQSLLIGKTPVAIVFMATTNANSPVTTTKDRQANANWKHGYAMALKNVHSSGSTVGYYRWCSTNTDVSGIPNTSSDTWQTSSSDMEGRTNTSFINTSSYPAGYAAKTTYASQATAPTASSGWFLPSSGQWYNILVNLGGMAAEPDHSYYWSGNTSSNFTSKICATALNNKISVVGAGNYDAFFSNTSSNEFYWSSSEDSSGVAYIADFNSGGDMSFARTNNKSFTRRVRAVIAF